MHATLCSRRCMMLICPCDIEKSCASGSFEPARVRQADRRHLATFVLRVPCRCFLHDSGQQHRETPNPYALRLVQDAVHLCERAGVTHSLRYRSQHGPSLYSSHGRSAYSIDNNSKAQGEALAANPKPLNLMLNTPPKTEAQNALSRARQSNTRPGYREIGAQSRHQRVPTDNLRTLTDVGQGLRI